MEKYFNEKIRKIVMCFQHNKNGEILFCHNDLKEILKQIAADQREACKQAVKKINQNCNKICKGCEFFIGYSCNSFKRAKSEALSALDTAQIKED